MLDGSKHPKYERRVVLIHEKQGTFNHQYTMVRNAAGSYLEPVTPSTTDAAPTVAKLPAVSE